MPRPRTGARGRVGIAVLLAGLATPLVALGTASTSSVAADGSEGQRAPRDAVVQTVKIGESVRGRAILAHRLGEPADNGVPTVVLIGAMHGNEQRTRPALWSILDGQPLIGAELWVIPTYNPDGIAAGTRRNAHGVDLNRNFPYRWADLDGNYESGPRPASEPETRAVMLFLARVRGQPGADPGGALAGRGGRESAAGHGVKLADIGGLGGCGHRHVGPAGWRVGSVNRVFSPLFQAWHSGAATICARVAAAALSSPGSARRGASIWDRWPPA